MLATFAALTGAKLPDDYPLNTRQTAVILDVEENTPAVWRCNGRYHLKYRKIGRKVRYLAKDVRAFLESRAATHTGEIID
jgi:hypothetical protein